jgi:peptide subunit release factor 1 (eRF1)
MFDRSDLQELASFGGEQPVLSVYLNLPPRLRGTPEAYRARLKGLLKKAASRAPEADIQAVQDFFEKQFDWVGRSVAVFSGQGDGLWRAEAFAVPVRSTVHVGDKPFILPLANLMDTYGSFSIALVDQQAIRMFHCHLGELVTSRQLDGEEVKRLKGGGGASGRSRGRGEDLSGSIQATVKGNFKAFADSFGAFCKHHDSEHVLLGGAETTLHPFKEELSQEYRDKIEGMFNIAMRAPEGEVLDRALDLMQRREEEREMKLVETVRTLAAKEANGVVGLEDTLNAIDAGRVQTLILVEGVIPPDQADPAIVRTVDYGGDVCFVAEDSPLAEQGGIGALLRY